MLKPELDLALGLRNYPSPEVEWHDFSSGGALLLDRVLFNWRKQTVCDLEVGKLS